jgi:hypothetical protein
MGVFMEAGVIDGGLKSSIEAKAKKAKPPDGMVIFPIPDEPRVKIVIDEQEGHEGHKPVPLSLNGYVIRIMRGHPVEIPESFVTLLEELMYDHYSKDDEGNDVMRQIPRFAWRRVA